MAEVSLTGEPRALQRAEPSTAVIALIEAPSQISQNDFTAIKPSRMSSILRSAAAGDIADWVDFTERMVDVDERLAGIMEDRTDTVTEGRLILEAGPHKADEGELAKAGALFIRDRLQELPNKDRLLADLLHGIFTGLAGAEHKWRFWDNTWQTRPRWVHGHLFRFGAGWDVEVLDKNRHWTSLPDRKFIIHIPRNRSAYPTRTAALRSVAWLWLFKFWAWTFWVTGAERLGNPLMIARVPRNAEARIRAKAKAATEKLSADQVAILEEGTGLEFPKVEYAQKAEVWQNLIATADKGIRLALTGITGDEKGEAEVNEKRISRAKKDSGRLAETLRRDLFEPWLRFNTHHFGGRMPPLPRAKWEFSDQQITDPNMIAHAINAGGVMKRDEFRRLLNLEPVGPDEGGEEWIGGKTEIQQPTSEQAIQQAARREARRASRLVVDIE